MIELHFFCPEGLNRRDLGGGRFESGYWDVSDKRADEALGGRIYLHQRKKEPSWQGGTIEDWYENEGGKKIFIYRENGDQNVLCLEGWSQVQATVRRGATSAKRYFWLTYKPLNPGSAAGWPPEKLTELARSFRNDPFGTTEWWRISAHKAAQVGDEVFLFKQGDGPRGIFGRGIIVARPKLRADSTGADGEKPRAEIQFVEFVDPKDGFLLTLDELRDALALESNNLVDVPASGNSVPPSIAGAIVARLDERARTPHPFSDDEADDGNLDIFDTSDQRARALQAICVRRGQSAFRAALMQAYGGRCAITGCAVAAVLEAAHIVPYNGPATNAVTNGLLLRTDLHTLFDCGLLAIDPKSRTVIIAKSLSGSSYGKLKGRRLRDALPITQGPSRKTLERGFVAFAGTVFDT